MYIEPDENSRKEFLVHQLSFENDMGVFQIFKCFLFKTLPEL